MSNKLNFTCPETLIYENEILHLTVLGGIKLEGMDRMRATLKICLRESSVPPVRHNLDLYNDTQLEKLVRKVAERLEIGTSVISASLAELTEQLEAYRLQRIKETQPQPYVSPKLTVAETKEAMQLLESPELLQKTNDLIGQSGVIGELGNRLLMYVIFTARKREEPLHIISLGASGVGKTHLQEKVAELIPEEDRIEITSLSENAFYYFGQREIKHKVIVIEDLDGVLSSLYPLRELMSKKEIRKTIAHKNTNGETRSVHLVVEGPICVAGCTTKESIYEDNANRSFMIYLDESPEQDERIMAYQRAVSAGKINLEEEQKAVKLLKNCQRLLEPIRVVNPYAEYLKLPKQVFKPRRTNTHYLRFIEAITFLHQHQRTKKVDENTGELYIQTTLEDVAEANKLLKEVLLRKSDELTGGCRNYLEEVKNYLKRTNKKEIINLELRKELRVNPNTQRGYNQQLIEAGLLQKVKGEKGKSFTYQIADEKEYTTLKSKIESALDECFTKLTRLTCLDPFNEDTKRVNSQKDSK